MTLLTVTLRHYGSTGSEGLVEAIPRTKDGFVPGNDIMALGPWRASINGSGTLAGQGTLDFPADEFPDLAWSFHVHWRNVDKRLTFGPYTYAEISASGVTSLADLVEVEPLEYVATSTLVQRVENLEAGGAVDPYDDTEVRALIADADTARANEDAVLNQRIDDIEFEAGAPTAEAIGNAMLGRSAPGGLSGSLRPTQFVKRYRVDPAGPNAPEFGKFTTLDACLTQVQADTQADAGSTLGAEGRTPPNRWRLVEVAPGDYESSWVTFPYVALIGLGQRPEDVRIWTDNENTSQAAHRAALELRHTCYISNVHFAHTGTDEFWHAVRCTGGNLSPVTYVLDDVLLTEPDNAPVDAQVIDAHIGPDATWIMHRVRMVGRSLPMLVNMVASSSTGAPGRVAFIECEAVSNQLTWVQNAVNVYDLSSMDANIIGFQTWNTRPDVWTWIGGKFITGTASGTPGFNKPPAGNIWCESTNAANTATWNVDPQTPLVNITGNAVGRVNRVVAPPPVPVGSVSASEWARAGVDIATVQRGPFGPAGTTYASLTAGRVYWVRVPVRDLIQAGQMSIHAKVADGTAVLAWASDVAGAPGQAPGNIASIWRPQSFTLQPGGNASDRPSFAGHHFSPGDGYVWLACAVSSATAQVATRTVRTGLTVKYADGWDGASPLAIPTSLTDLPSGAPFPTPLLWPLAEWSDTDELRAVGPPTQAAVGIPRPGQRYVDEVAVGGATRWIATDTHPYWRPAQLDTGEVDLLGGGYLPAGLTASSFTATRMNDMVILRFVLTAVPSGYGAGSTLLPTRFRMKQTWGVISSGSTSAHIGNLIATNTIAYFTSAAVSGVDTYVTIVGRAAS